MKNLLNSVRVEQPQSSMFDLSHKHKLSGNMGNLIPVMIMDAVPGDRVRCASSVLCRLAPMVAPMMHEVNVYTHTFFVPKRLLWDNWVNYITNQKVGGVLPAHPYFEYDGADYTKLMDYAGIPPAAAGLNTHKIDPMFFAAYQFVWNEYYRDQNLQAAVDYKLVDGIQTTGIYNSIKTLRRRAWEHDYFTAALPFAQKGDAVEIPVSGDVSLKPTTALPGKILAALGHGAIGGTGGDVRTDNAGGLINAPNGGGLNVDSVYDPNGTLEVTNVNTTINDLRKAYALQRFLEKMARYGTRFTEYLRGVFGVQSSDRSLQRPEYITGSKSPIVIGEVLNTSATATQPQGDMAGHGVSYGGSDYGSYFCEEHGIVLTLLSVLPRTAYQQGIPKMFLKVNDPFEHFVPDFDHIGEQEILKKEIYADSADPDGTFGYIPRYCEYKFMNSRVSGDFRTTLDFWTMGRIFSSEPALNDTFIQCDPTHRVFANTNPADDKLWMLVDNSIYANRLMSRYSTPTF